MFWMFALFALICFLFPLVSIFKLFDSCQVMKYEHMKCLAMGSVRYPYICISILLSYDSLWSNVNPDENPSVGWQKKHTHTKTAMVKPLMLPTREYKLKWPIRSSQKHTHTKCRSCRTALSDTLKPTPATRENTHTHTHIVSSRCGWQARNILLKTSHVG